ncbi:MAG TPA: type II toxin-antitoxin system VapC family toxin [Methylomirabilota bacterium]|nr:type II toxin-antitoxin system VapC family toxin [Methylomirabilota bacterium]
MRILLDTHCWLWMLIAPERLSPDGRAHVTTAENELLLSAGSVWEIAIKHALGRLRLPMEPAEYIPNRLAATGSVPLAIDYRHALRVGQLPRHHRDPFDRILIAQAQVEGIPILTSDPHFARYDVELLPA